jgi:FkbM family methyltransferase
MLKPVVRRFARRLGYEILRPPEAFAAETTLNGLLLQENINLILDVGANVGQFVYKIRAAGYGGRIVSFEPQAAAHAELCISAARDQNWTVADRTALGAEVGILTLNKSANSVSSSILPMLASHSNAEPQAGYDGTEQVRVNRLDDLYTLAPADRALLKIDVQGYEKPVLDGAKKLLSNCCAMIIEMSFIPLYEGQILAKQLWERLEAEGFEVWAFEPAFRDQKTGRMLQVDGLFVRRKDGAST